MSRKEPRKEILGLTRITKKRILELCRKDKLYQTPELNDVLYLHYQGFDCIECLEDYTELKCLWLESNAISEIQGLENQTKLKCLFLQSNLIRKIENLESCKELDTLNLSQNHIRKIENCGIEVLPVLNTLNLSSNYLKDCESLRELEKCKTLSVLDLSNNRIDDILVVKIFSVMPELKVLILQGNPVISKIPQYRKTMILECINLTYLDSRPVFPKDRACAEAWKQGGYEAERKENERWNRKDRKKIRDSVNATISLRNKHRKLEDQISLLPSSDSEDDIEKQKKITKSQLDSKTKMDLIWNEVAEEQLSDATADSTVSDSSQSSENGSNAELVDTNINNKEHTDLIMDQEIGEGEKIQAISEESQLEKIVDGDEDDEIIKQIDSGTDMQDNYENIFNVQENTSESEDFLESSYETQIDNPEENYEPLNELEKVMNIFSKPATYELSSCQLKAEAENQMEIDEEHLRINNQVEDDFEELTQNMTNFVQQLEKEQAERQEVIQALFTREVAAKDSTSESSDDENKAILENLQFECLVEKWDNESKIKNGNFGTITEKIINKEQIPLHFKKTEVRENMKLMKINEDTELTNSSTALDPDNMPSELTDHMELADFDYVPMDFSSLTRQSNEALSAFEKESQELKKLLQKLENKNEELYKEVMYQQDNENCEEEQENRHPELKSTENELQGNLVFESNAEEYVRDRKDVNFVNDEEVDETGEDDKSLMAAIIVEDILQAIDLKQFNIKSYQFPDDLSEYQDDSDLAIENKLQEVELTKTIPEFIESMNQFFEKIGIDREQKDKSCYRELAKQKLHALKASQQQPNFRDFNNDTLESLNKQLEAIRKNKHQKVRRMVDRVYAQKDRYDDTLELVDGKLMVRNKDTEELQELPHSSQKDLSDSEDNYDTAQSEGEEKGLIKTELFARKSPYKPVARKSSEDLVIRALIENSKNKSNEDFEESDDDDNDDEDDDDEFYSLDDHDKQNLYNIDKEFFNKLSFDFTNLTQTDENHIVQCARSYEELKHYLTLSKEERCLTEEENELLENMIQSKCVKNNENSEHILTTLNNNSDLSKEEQLWLNKIKSQELKIPPCCETACPPSEEGKGIMEQKSESIIDETLLRDILQFKEIDYDDDNDDGDNDDDDESLQDKKNQEQLFEQQSEEEKNEIENNIDIESCIANTKQFDSIENFKVLNDQTKFVNEKEKEILTEIPGDESNLKKSDVQVLECNLEIIGDNDEVVDTISVNAELHF